MSAPVIIKGREPENVLEVSAPCTSVLLVMRRPAAVRNRDAKVKWFVSCQVGVSARVIGAGISGIAWITVPAFPRRRVKLEPYFVADELPIAPLPAALRAVAVAYYPLVVRRWRFEFFAEKPQDPDATAEALAFPVLANRPDCGFFRTPHRAGRQ